MLNMAREHEVLIPIHERTIIPISKRLSEFKGIVKIPIPAYSTLQLALDKANSIRLAQRVDVPTPQTYIVDDMSQLQSLSNELQYPVVIKLRQEAFMPPPRYTYANSKCDFVMKYELMHKKCPYPIVQELVRGVGYGFFAIFNEDHDPIAIFCHKRLREYPITGGPSAYCASTYDDRLTELGLKLLTSMKWYGAAMVEFRRDIRDGEFKLMEVNPRFWGSLGLPISSGVDFPTILYNMAVGKAALPTLPKYEIDRKWRLLLNDVHSLNQAMHESPCKAEYLVRFIGSFFDRRVVYGDADLSDLSPIAYEIGCGIRRRAETLCSLIQN
jgi:predicted ATP-grasp superfamily ATP-dependent carboligase